MKFAHRARVKYLARVNKGALARAGASRYLIRKIKHHARLSPRMEKKALRVYRSVQYRILKNSGLNSSESRRFYNVHPSKVSAIVRKMDKNVKKIEKIFLVKEERKKGEKEALRAIRKNLSKKGWTFQDIEMYIRQVKSVGASSYRSYKRYCERHGTVAFDIWKSERDQEAARKALYSEAAKKGWRRRKHYR